MAATFRSYEPETDFGRVRAFLLDTYSRFGAPVNWGIERWNYARHFVAPMLGSYGVECGRDAAAAEAIRFWEDMVGVWEEDGELVGAAMIEHPDESHPCFGEIFVQRHPERLDLLDEMMDYGERRFADPGSGSVHIWVYGDDIPYYDREHDLVVLAPDGTYAACCIFWYDSVNRIGHIEPLGTRPGYRKMGLATEIMMEAFRRLRDLGATKVPMTGGFDPFYEAIGFRKMRTAHVWVKRPS